MRQFNLFYVINNPKIKSFAQKKKQEKNAKINRLNGCAFNYNSNYVIGSMKIFYFKFSLYITVRISKLEI